MAVIVAEKNSCRSILYLQTIMLQTSSYFLDNTGQLQTEDLYRFYFSLTRRESEATLDDCLNHSDTLSHGNPADDSKTKKAASYKACCGVGSIKSYKKFQVHVPFPMFT